MTKDCDSKEVRKFDLDNRSKKNPVKPNHAELVGAIEAGRRWLSVMEAAEYLGVSRDILYRMIRDQCTTPDGRTDHSLQFNIQLLDAFSGDEYTSRADPADGLSEDEAPPGVDLDVGRKASSKEPRSWLQNSLNHESSLPPEFRGGVLTVQQTADYLQVSSKTIIRLMQTGHLSWHRVGRVRRVSIEDLRAFLRRQELR
ncbi:MAG: helix-turn-helix domain-containing protein [Myxococcota bacterium]